MEESANCFHWLLDLNGCVSIALFDKVFIDLINDGNLSKN